MPDSGFDWGWIGEAKLIRPSVRSGFSEILGKGCEQLLFGVVPSFGFFRVREKVLFKCGWLLLTELACFCRERMLPTTFFGFLAYEFTYRYWVDCA